MKKLLLLLGGCLAAFGAGSVNQSTAPINNSNGFIVTLNWTGDSITGSVPATTIQGAQQLQGQRIVSVETAPLSPAPTNGYTITLTDFSGVDLLTGNGVNQSATTPALLTLPSGQPPLYGSYTLNVTGNSVASAQGRVVIYFAPVSGIVGVLGPLGTLTASGATPSGGANTTNPVKIAGAFNTTQPTVTNGQIVDVQSTARGAQIVATGVDPFAVSGPVASGSANANNPVKSGGVFNTTQPTVTNSQVVDFQATARGAQIVATGVDALNTNPGLPTPSSGTITVTSATGTGTIINLTINSAVNSATVEFITSGSVTGGFVQVAPDSFGTSCVNMNSGAVGTSIALSSVGVSIYRCDTAGATTNFTVVLTAALTGTGSVAITAKLSGGPAPPIVVSQGSDVNNNSHPLGVVTNGGSTAASVLQVGGSDGTLTHNFLTDTTGRLGTNGDVTASGTINGNGQSVSVSMSGLASASVTFSAGNNLVATLAAQYSTDGGTTWTGTPTRFAGFYLWIPGGFTSFAQPSHILVPGGASNIRITSTAFTSGSATVTLRATRQPEELPSAGGSAVTGNNFPAPPATMSVSTVDANSANLTSRSLNSDITASGALGALNANVAISLNGMNSFGLQIPSGNNLVATAQCQYSIDGGTTWWATLSNGKLTGSGNEVWFGPNVTLNSTSGPYSCRVPAGASNMRYIITAYTSGTATVTVRASMQPESLPANVGDINSIISPFASQNGGSDYGAVAVMRVNRTDTQGNSATDKGISTFKTYQSQLLGWSIAATPTDIAFLPGNASNTVIVTRVELSCVQTTAGTIDILLARRTAANTGGTTTAFSTNVVFDTNDAASQSSPLAYTANPATITGDGTFVSRKIFVTNGATAGEQVFVWTPEPMGKPLLLRGTSQSVNINLNGQTTTGLSCDAEFQWIETNLI